MLQCHRCLRHEDIENCYKKHIQLDPHKCMDHGIPQVFSPSPKKLTSFSFCKLQLHWTIISLKHIRSFPYTPGGSFQIRQLASPENGALESGKSRNRFFFGQQRDATFSKDG